MFIRVQIGIEETDIPDDVKISVKYNDGEEQTYPAELYYPIVRDLKPGDIITITVPQPEPQPEPEPQPV